MLLSSSQKLLMQRATSKHPLITIVGATGTGKSKLAVSLAERFNGEIINADSLQMYEGLHIATNKISLAEQKNVPHHLLNCIKLGEEPWIVLKFIEEAQGIIKEIRSRGKLPILVGGNHYYTQSLLFDDTTLENLGGLMTAEAEDQRWPILAGRTEDMLAELHKVDPSMAARWHPGDRRKIRRSLAIWLTSGKTATATYLQQLADKSNVSDSNQSEGLLQCDGHDDAKLTSNIIGPSLRYNTLIFWVHAASKVLNPRLEERVQTMIQNGLLQEVESMYDFVKEQEVKGHSIDQSRGVWIAIGYKELIPYITAIKSGLNDPKHLDQLKKDGIEKTQIATRQYAKYQDRWIRVTLRRCLQKANEDHRLFPLDASWADGFTSTVEGAAATILNGFMASDELPTPVSLAGAAAVAIEKMPNLADVVIARRCDVCDKIYMYKREWEIHLSSKRHKSRIKPKEINIQRLRKVDINEDQP